jgi:HSP20 family protein
MTAPGGKSAGGDMAIQPNDDAACLYLLREHLDEICAYICRMRDHGSRHHEFSPSIDIYEALEQYVIEVDLPGLSEDDLTVTVSNCTLRIEGSKPQGKNGPAVNFICLERRFGRFARTVEIPAAFDPATLQKSFARGVLTLRVDRRIKD